MVTRDGIGERRLLPALTLVLALFAIAAILYARVQNIWVDETTQLSGSTLTPGPLLAWLAGDLQLPFGVPPDRMPPVSYFIDMIGWRIWGDNLLAFRLLHAAITGLGIAVLMAAVARRFSLAAALATGLILALSPKLVETAVEIRAYPIFFTLSCLQLAMVLRGEVAARTGRMALFILLGLLSAYTHFFGVIATSAYLVAIVIDVRDGRSAARVAIGYALLLLLWTGLAPFIFGAVSNSPANQIAATDLDAIATFVLQLISNAAIMVDPVNALLYFGGIALLVLLGAIGLLAIVRARGLEARHDPAVGIALALIAGIGVVLCAAFVIKGFSTLAPRYNIWLMPPVALMIGLAATGAITPAGKAARGFRLGAFALLLIGAIWAQIAFLKRADWFIHGPSTTLEQMIADSDAPVAIVHAGQGWAWGYFPLYWKHRDALPQWLLTPDGRAAIRIGRGGDPGGTPQPLSALNGYRTLLVSQVRLLTYEDLRLIKADPSRIAAGGELAPGLASAGWRPGQPVYRPGNYAFTGQLYHKPRTPGPAAPIAPAS